LERSPFVVTGEGRRKLGHKRLKETVIKPGILRGQGGDMWKLTVIRNRAVQIGGFWPQLNTASINQLKHTR
jgi:hypothetical protein